MPNIANFSHNYKGKALAGSLTHAKSAALLTWAASPRTSPHKWTTGLAAAQRQSRFALSSAPDCVAPGTRYALRVNFASDNTAPVAPQILDAIVAANAGYALGYGNDDWTAGVERRLSEIYEREVAAFLVPTGTAANALAFAQLTPP